MNKKPYCLALYVLGLNILILCLILVSSGCERIENRKGKKTYNKGGTSIPKQVRNHRDWREINAGYMQTCGIKTDGSLWCWGKNVTGQVGDGTTTNRFSPAPVKKSCQWLTVALGDHHTCGICSDNSLWCWGGHKNGVVRYPHETTDTFPELVLLKPYGSSKDEPPLNFRETVLGDGHTCGLTTKGAIYCWGGVPEKIGAGQIDFIPISPSDDPLPIPIDTSKIYPPPTFKSLVVGSGHTCGLTLNGQAYCWGRNDRGQVGINSSEKWVISPSPVNVEQMTSSKTFKKIAAGTYHTCGIMDDGAAYCWGANDSGQLGIGDNKDQRIPARVNTKYIRGNKEFILISGGFARSCAITQDNAAYCWGGYGEYVQGKCDNNQPNEKCFYPAPLDTSEVRGKKIFKWISAGCAHSCAVTVEGQGYCWGNNEDGRLGIGLSSNKQ